MKAATIDGMDWQSLVKFQSTPPVKAATEAAIAQQLSEIISIHAAREGGDFLYLGFHFVCEDFNPRRP